MKWNMKQKTPYKSGHFVFHFIWVRAKVPFPKWNSLLKLFLANWFIWIPFWRWWCGEEVLVLCCVCNQNGSFTPLCSKWVHWGEPWLPRGSLGPLRQQWGQGNPKSNQHGFRPSQRFPGPASTVGQPGKPRSCLPGGSLTPCCGSRAREF